MHRKSQSTSALSVILSTDNASSSRIPLSNQPLPSLSEGEAVDSPHTPSKRTQGSRISHSRTRSDLGSLVAESRDVVRKPVASRRIPEGLPASSRLSSSGIAPQLERRQAAHRRETKPGSADDSSDTSDHAVRRPSTKPTEDTEGLRSGTPRKRSKADDVRPGPSRRTPRKGSETPKRSRGNNGFDDLTLDRCPSLVGRCPRLLMETLNPCEITASVSAHNTVGATQSATIHRAGIRPSLS